MAEIHLFGILSPTAGKEEYARQVFTDIARQVELHEPDCLRWEFFFHEDTGDFIFIERYKNQAALDKHMKQPYVVKMKDAAFGAEQAVSALDLRFLTPGGGFAER